MSDGLLKSAEQLADSNLNLTQIILRLTRERDTLEAENVRLILENKELNEKLKERNE